MSETVKENIAQTVLLFIKNNLALLSAFVFLCFSLFDLYVFKETFHMNGAVFFNRVLPNAFGSFSQFWPYIFLPIITVIFVFGILYAWQFFSLDTVFKYVKSLISDSKKLDTKYKKPTVFLIYFFSIFADILLLFILSKFNIQQPSLFFFFFASL
ncbi:hypothetical protein JWV37_06250 [Sulfurospirillum sp. T05]|uniref:Uncharacterized protein n=1 Tax=Sulfurospirillum tamanense TaxID=2813362 RepID=A0ABS2WT72_9BACT|nr:hypothetical protein [Sulfurospirillum tamanensis]MBN2964374.1 hypothetical protein [Sulfurospirillum tamanensis]